MRGKILITGGLGNLGSWLTSHFSKLEWDVYVLTQKEKYQLKNARYTVIQADISDYVNLKSKLDMVFDYCIHLASLNEVATENYAKKALLINSLGSRNLVEVLKDKSIKKFIYLSTIHVYGAKEGTVTEVSALAPQNDYAMTHLFAEYYVKQLCDLYAINYTIFRLSNSYGCPKMLETNKWYLVLNNLVKSAYEQHKIVIKTNGKASRDFIWMGDVCNVLSAFEKMPSNTVYNLASGENVTILDLAKIVQKVYMERFHKPIEIVVNQQDETIYREIKIDNSQLIKDFAIDLNQKFEDEIEKIFDLLEQCNV